MACWLFFFSGSTGQPFTTWMMFIGFFTSLIVGLFEEYAVTLLAALRRRLPVLPALVLSSLLFAAYHLQAQPLPLIAIF